MFTQGFCPLPCPAFRVTGKDALRYLHGRLTQDVKGLSSNSTALSLLLSSQGRIEGKLQLVRRANDFLIVCDPILRDSWDSGEFLQSLLRFKVADDVQVEPLPLRTVFALGQETLEVCIRKGFELPRDGFAESSNGQDFVFTAGLPNIPAWLLLVKDDTFSSLIDQAATVSESEYDSARIWAGHYVFGLDITEKTLAPELPLEPFVSFTKGCYTGQEVVEMATARGRPNRQLVFCEGAGTSAPAAGALIVLKSQPDKAVGEVTSSAFNSQVGSYRFLGFVRSQFETEELFCHGADCHRLSLS